MQISSLASTAPEIAAFPSNRPVAESELTTRQAFQEFVAGTFYNQMFKSLRKLHDKPAYLDGGRAEEIFRSQLDQQVAEDLSRTHGASFADPLFDQFQSGLRR